MVDSPQPISIRILLVDDHQIVREGLKSALEAYINLKVVGEARDGEEAVLSAGKLQPAVIVMDINMDRMDGITATRLIKAQNPEVVIVGLSMGVEDHYIYAMKKAGAFEVLSKDVAVTELYAAIQRGVAAVKPILILEQPSSLGEAQNETDEAQERSPTPPNPRKEQT